MAEPDFPSIHSPTSIKPAREPTLQKNPSAKFLSGFLYKSILFAVFVAILPFFPPHIPDSGGSLLSRTWELLHLLLVGIAVSYGLFSRRNADADLDKDVTWKSDSPQTYVSRILQVSSMFEDDADGGSGEESKVEIWSSQYQRTDPVVIVANGGSSAVDSSGQALLLPPRSLKKSRSQNSETNGGVVLPSPIPWRSRSGRMELKHEGSATNADKVASRTPSFRSAKASSPPPPEICAKTSAEYSLREKSLHGGSPPLVPPPPPPPPPPLGHGSLFSDKREVKKSFKDELKDLSRKGSEGFLGSSHLHDEVLSSPKSVRTMIIVSDDSESENEINLSDVEEAENSPAEARAAEENEVDKKADEFIAKFREQIRLQRIESIKKSSGHRAGRNPK
ncbi:hypothetical protein AXF42_Ash018710 [Apostasia shenzhenica]|uniref:Uncharacterized protein n=1 Tax=Apostasia shenzhenica TaxID=1088818 RepID=A0A2H9ZZQ0_9ASPA|nr:hypothetical protein AXF42_Ash018710 [Apostasia shenzhenica]